MMSISIKKLIFILLIPLLGLKGCDGAGCLPKVQGQNNNNKGAKEGGQPIVGPKPKPVQVSSSKNDRLSKKVESNVTPPTDNISIENNPDASIDEKNSPEQGTDIDNSASGQNPVIKQPADNETPKKGGVIAWLKKKLLGGKANQEQPSVYEEIVDGMKKL